MKPVAPPQGQMRLANDEMAQAIDLLDEARAIAFHLLLQPYTIKFLLFRATHGLENVEPPRMDNLQGYVRKTRRKNCFLLQPA